MQQGQSIRTGENIGSHAINIGDLSAACHFLSIEELSKSVNLPTGLLRRLYADKRINGIEDCDSKNIYFLEDTKAALINIATNKKLQKDLWQCSSQRQAGPCQGILRREPTKEIFTQPVTFPPQSAKPVTLQESASLTASIQTKKTNVVELREPEDVFSVSYLQNFDGKQRVIPGFKGLSVRKNNQSLVLTFRTKANNERLDFMKFKDPQSVTEQDIETIKKAHQRFRVCVNKGRPWNNVEYLLKGKKRRLETFNDLLNFYQEGIEKVQQIKVARFKRRYFSGALGERLLSTYSREQFRKDFLDVSHPDRQASDRNEVIKILSAACNRARDTENIDIDIQTLVRSEDRSYADKTDKKMPTLLVFDAVLAEAYRMKKFNLCISMLLQFFISTRKAKTNGLRWQQFDLDSCTVEVPAAENKNGRLVRHPYPIGLNPLLCNLKSHFKYKPRISLDKSENPIFLFESAVKPGQPVWNFSRCLEEVKLNLIDGVNALGKNNADVGYKARDVQAFTQHRMRDLMDMQLLKVGATENQKEKAAGRATSNKARAYENLTIECLVGLKDKVFSKLPETMPNFKRVFEGLVNAYSLNI